MPKNERRPVRRLVKGQELKVSRRSSDVAIFVTLGLFNVFRPFVLALGVVSCIASGVHRRTLCYPLRIAMKVAIQGELGSFSHEASGNMLPAATVVPCARSAEVFDRVEGGSVQAAVIPIENSLAGSVAEHFDLLLTREVFVHREFYLRIRHNLIAMPGVKRNAIRQVFSHPVALDQCRKFFRSHPDRKSVV